MKLYIHFTAVSIFCSTNLLCRLFFYPSLVFSFTGLQYHTVQNIRNKHDLHVNRIKVLSAKKDSEDDFDLQEKQLWKNFSSKRLQEDSQFNFESILELSSVLGQKGLDTIEDAILHYRRLQAEGSYLEKRIQQESAADCLKQWNANDDPRPRLLVVGSGWGAHAVIKIIDSLDDGYRVLCVSPKNYFLFTPMLASTSVGTIEFRSIVEPIRDSNPTIEFIEGNVVDIYPFKKTVEVMLSGDSTIDKKSLVNSTMISIPYDVAVYACGVQAGGSSGNMKIEGVTHQNCHFLKDIPDALRLRVSVGDMLERASRPGLRDDDRRKMLHFVVVGGGATGVEYAAELSDCIDDITSKSRKAPYSILHPFVSITLIHGGASLLPQFDESLRGIAKDSLESRGVDVKLSTRVLRVLGPSSLEITQKGMEDKIETLNCGVLVWAAGTAPVPLTSQLTEKLNNAQNVDFYGRIPVDKWLRVIGAPPGSLFALGDASLIVSDNNRDSLPQTAQVAAQQGAYVARLLNRGYDLSGNRTRHDGSSAMLSPPFSHEAKTGDIGTLVRLRGDIEAKPFKFLNLGLMAFLGGGEALSQIQVGSNKINRAGIAGFLLWRSVYIVKQVSTRSRILVLFDWFKCKVFGRDMTRF